MPPDFFLITFTQISPHPGRTPRPMNLIDELFTSSAILHGQTYDGPTWNSTTYHLNFVSVPANLKVAHRKGEPTLVTLVLRDGQVLLTELK
jgi:hypothetical protein